MKSGSFCLFRCAWVDSCLALASCRVGVDRPIDASLEGRWALERYRRSLPGLSAAELRRDAERLAELALVTQPAVIHWLLARVLEMEKAALPPVEDWHRGLASELLGRDCGDQAA